MYPRDGHLVPDIHDLEIRQVWLRDGLIDLLVGFNSTQEIPFGLFRRGILVIRIPRRDLESNVRCDNSRVVAEGF